MLVAHLPSELGKSANGNLITPIRVNNIGGYVSSMLKGDPFPPQRNCQGRTANINPVFRGLARCAPKSVQQSSRKRLDIEFQITAFLDKCQATAFWALLKNVLLTFILSTFFVLRRWLLSKRTTHLGRKALSPRGNGQGCSLKLQMMDDASKRNLGPLNLDVGLNTMWWVNARAEISVFEMYLIQA